MRVLLLMILAVFSLSVSAQTITATGNVKDATGDPIIGASIVEKEIPPMVRLPIWMVISLSKFLPMPLLLFHTSV